MSKWLVTLSIKDKNNRHDYFKDCYVDFCKKKPTRLEIERLKRENRTYASIDINGLEHWYNPTIIFMQKLAEN